MKRFVTSRSCFKLIAPFFCLFFTAAASLPAQSIKEKKEGLTYGVTDLDPEAQELLKRINLELMLKQEELRTLYSQVMQLFQQNAPQEKYQELLAKINAIKSTIEELNNRWREGATRANQEEGYGLWYQPDTNVEQLVIDYGSHDYVYLVSPEIGAIKLSVDSNLPIPRSSWSEMLETILTQNGVGIKQLNPYLRQLYSLGTNQSAVKVITNKRQDLELFPNEQRISFVLSPEPSDVRRIWFFLDKFVNHASTVLQLVGRDILIIGSVSEVRDLMKLYDFAAMNKGEKDYKLVSLSKISAEEMAKILAAVFDQIIEQKKPQRQRPGNGPQDVQIEIESVESNGLKVITLENMAQALFLVGTKDEIHKAEQIIREVDGQLGDVRAKVIYRYAAKNSEAEDLAAVVSKIYELMIAENVGSQQNGQYNQGFGQQQQNQFQQPMPPTDFTSQGQPIEVLPARPTQQKLYHDSFYQDGNVAVNPAPVTLFNPQLDTPGEPRYNFIVDEKTNSIVMVVEADILPKIKELLLKLDVPKKMVQIEVLLFEKRIANQTQFGLDLLRIGSTASNTKATGIAFSDVCPLVGDLCTRAGATNIANNGVLNFILSRPKNDAFPAFDLAYNFLLSQQDVQINASPSLTTMNQTPAKLAIVEEFSINTGIFEVETNGGATLKDSFTRAQYGITLEIIPTIHMMNEDDEDDNGRYCGGYQNSKEDMPDYLTVETNVTFDTVQPNITQPDRPTVTRRNITNEVLIPDGQTIIIGGLRRKNTNDSKTSIPFLGELPGIGIFFSDTSLVDDSTEMFICITPKIIADPVEDIERLKREEVSHRPGDIPEFLCCLEAARRWEKQRLLEGTLRMLLGRPPERCYIEGEYDGR